MVPYVIFDKANSLKVSENKKASLHVVKLHINRLDKILNPFLLSTQDISLSLLMMDDTALWGNV